jgi:hypothetical protein
MTEQKTTRRGQIDPLAKAAREAFKSSPGGMVKGVALAVNVSLNTAHSWVHYVRRIPQRMRYQLAAATEAEIHRQNAGARADAIAQCRREMAGGADEHYATQVADGHHEVDRGAAGKGDGSLA